jgi:divinyl protochlorophyllide a 8-vinyl-reductase
VLEASLRESAAEVPPHPVTVALIGPNAITQLAAAIERLHGGVTTRSVFTEAGLAHHLDHPPSEMVDEADVISLHRAGRGLLGDTAFMAVAGLAGSLTGDYILGNRIPVAARTVLPRLPGFIASRVLARAIANHAWTFAGSGRFACQFSREGVLFTIEDSPLTRELSSTIPCCHYYTATFERLFRALVTSRARVSETRCAAAGAPDCRFLVS